jgi:hypothetical protein
MSTVLGVPAGQPSLSVPLFTGVRGIGILRSSHSGHSPKFAVASTPLGWGLSSSGRKGNLVDLTTCEHEDD